MRRFDSMGHCYWERFLYEKGERLSNEELERQSQDGGKFGRNMEVGDAEVFIIAGALQ